MGGQESDSKEWATPTSTSDGERLKASGDAWRLDVDPTLTWEAFLSEVQSVMALPTAAGKSLSTLGTPNPAARTRGRSVQLTLATSDT